MKKIIIGLLLCLCILTTGCTKNNYKMEVSYDVCWPDTVMHYDTIVNCTYMTDICDRIFNVDNTPRAYTVSYNGSNYINIRPGNIHLIQTTAPIRLHNFKKVD